MKIVLINTPYLFVYKSLNVGRNFYFPLGIGYIAAVLKQNGFDVRIVDAEPLNFGEAQLADYLKRENPDLVGISCATANFSSACKVGEAAKKSTGAKVIIGGIHATVMWQDILEKYPQFDAVIIGEGEVAMLELCKTFEHTGQADFSDIPGIAFRCNNEIRKNSDRPLMENLDELPYPARELVDLSLYRAQVHIYRGRKSASIITSRGCPFGCSYCASFNTMGRRYRTHSPDYVFAEMKHLYENYKIRDFIIVDDEFTVDRQRTKQICQLLIQSNLDIGWYCFTRVSHVDEELLDLMKKAGCYSINFGIESADLQVLKNIGKKITLEQAERAIKIANKIGIKTVAGYMFGNNGDTIESMRKTIDFALKVSPVIANFNIMVPFPGTRDYERLKLRHPQMNNTWDDFTPTKVNQYLDLENVSPKELQRIVSSAYLRFYFRPSQIIRLLKNVKSFKEIAALIRGMVGVINQAIAWRR